MISTANILYCGVAALALWGGPGWLLARGLGFSRSSACAIAPALGWAMQTAAALSAALIFGFSSIVILLVTAVLSFCAPLLQADAPEEERPFPLPALAIAAALALVPALAVLPKVGTDGAIALASPIYDHAKIILIDEIARHGTLPPANPVYGAGGAPGVVAYYYLWHFGAAQLAFLAGARGWEADAAATWFSAFAALALVAGLAFRLRPGAAAPLLALLAAAAGSLRPVADAVLGPALDRAIAPATGLAGLLHQASWSPHHLASASCAVLATMLMAGLRAQPAWPGAAALAFVMAAGFGSSLWVGGVTFGLAGVAVALALAAHGPRAGGGRFLAAAAMAAVVAGVLVAPLLVAQINMAAVRGGGAPLHMAPFAVLGPLLPEGLRTVLDVPAFWLVLLPLQFPAIALAGAAGLALVMRDRTDGTAAKRRLGLTLGTLAFVSLLVSAFLASIAGENNDLGWRAVLPAVLVLSAAAGVALAAALDGRQRAALAAALVLIALGLPDTLALAGRNAAGERSVDGHAFAGDPDLWKAVRHEVGAEVRIASNPERLEKLAPWPINLSWALLSRRRSCFAGREMALAFAPLTSAEREEAAGLFARVFAGTGTRADVKTLRTAFGCGAAVVTTEDGAWWADPFAASPLYRLAREEEGRWRIYVAATGGSPR